MSEYQHDPSVQNGIKLALAAAHLVAWMDTNSIDPANPPSCACGGEHWTCTWPDGEDDEDDED